MKSGSKLIFLLLGIIIGILISPRSMKFEFGTNHRDKNIGPQFKPKARMRDGGGLVVKGKKPE